MISLKTGSCSATQEIPHQFLIRSFIPCLQKPTFRPYPGPDKWISNFVYYPSKFGLNIITPNLRIRLQRVTTRSKFPHQNSISITLLIFPTHATYTAACILFKIWPRHSITWLVFFMAFFRPFKQIQRYVDHDKLKPFPTFLVTVTQSFDSIQGLNYWQSC